MNPSTARLMLTFATGSLIGLQFVLAKVLLNAGLGPLTMSLVQVSGAALVLAVMLRLGGTPLPFDRSTLAYFALSALIGVFAGPLLGNWVIARIPTGIFTLLVTLSPMFTALLNSALDRRLPPAHVAIGAGIGLAGVAVVLVPRAQAVGSEQALALSIAIGVPLLLAAGNVFRSRRWPQGLGAPAAAMGTFSVQAVLLAPLALAHAQHSHTSPLAIWPLLALLIAMTVTSGVLGSLLQRVAGAASFSQIGYVIALTGVAADALRFDEAIGATFWPALALVFTGILITNRNLAPRAARSTPPANALPATR